jgi:hypothetical protein
MPLVAAALGVIVLAGCGPHSDRLEISGEVTLDGAPLNGGSIRFTSLSERTISTGSNVEDGEFDIPQEKGLPPGTYHVEITAPDRDSPPIMVVAIPGEPPIPVQPERIPAKYNTDSKQTFEVTADGDNHFVIDLSSRSTK